jgi:hypothetical protein
VANFPRQPPPHEILVNLADFGPVSWHVQSSSRSGQRVCGGPPPPHSLSEALFREIGHGGSCRMTRKAST